MPRNWGATPPGNQPKRRRRRQRQEGRASSSTPEIQQGVSAPRRHAPEKHHPVHSEISTGLDLPTRKEAPRRHERGRFAPPPSLGPGQRLESPRHERERPFNEWLSERIFHPDHKEELRILGFAGAAELEHTRQRIQNHIFNMNAQRVGRAHKLTSAATEGPLTETFWTPEQEAEARVAGHQSTLDPTQLLEMAGVDPERVGEMLQHPVRAFQGHQRLTAQAERDPESRIPQIGIIPFGETGAGAVARKAAADARRVAATEGAQRDMYDAATVDLAFNESQGHMAVAEKYGLNPDVLHQYAAQHSERLTGRILSNRPVWQEGHADYDAARRQALEQGAPPQYPAAFTARMTPSETRRIRGGTPGPFKGGAPGRITKEERTQRYGDLTTWKPQSPSTPTAYAMRVMDRFQERLAKRVDEMRLSRSKTRRATGKALTPLSARRTVPINRAKRAQRQEPRRARGRTAEERRILRAPGHFMGVSMNEGDQLAHAVWIQLPEAYRNVEGLKRWQGNLHQELADISDTSSTGFAGKIDGYIEEAQARLKEAGQRDDITALRQAQAEIAELQMIKADIPYRVQDINEAIEKFDQVIKKPPVYDPRVAESAQTLNDEAESIIARYFPEEAETFGPRKEKVSRWLGIQPTGEEQYLHHGLQPGGQIMGAGTGVGRITKPAGVGQRLGMTLARTGRVRLSLEPVIEHWQQAQSYELAATMRDDLARMGTPITERPGMRPAKDDIVVNPEGRPKLRAWQRDPEVGAAEESFNPEDYHIQKLEDFTRSFVAEGKEREALIQEAIASGQLDQIRVIPHDVFDRYVGQYKDAQQALPRQLRPVGKVVDAVNSVIYASLIYSNPGYIPANLAANFIMHFAQAGVFVPSDFARSVQILQARGPRMQRLRDQLRSEVGHGPTVEAASGGKVMKKLTRGIAMIPDDPVRISAFLHEAARLDVIPKVLPRLRQKDIDALENLLNNPNFRSRLNDVQDRAVQAMVDFERLGPLERAYAKRIMFVWSWMRGASRYPGRFALDHPGRTAIMAYALAGAPGAPKELRDKLHQFMPTIQEGMPPWLEGAIHVGGTEEEPWILPTRAISPISTPYDLIQTARSAPGAQTFGELLNPAIPMGWHIANRESPYGRQLDTYGEAALQGEERMAPLPNLIRDLVNPPEDTGMYPWDKSRLGRLARASRVVPYPVNAEEAQKSRVREGMTSSVDASVAEFESDAQKYLKHPAPPEIVHQARVKLQLDHDIRKDAEDEDRHIDYGKALQITLEYLQREKGISPDVSKLTTQEAAHKAYLAYRRFMTAGYSAYDSTIQKYKEAERGRQHVG